MTAALVTVLPGRSQAAVQRSGDLARSADIHAVERFTGQGGATAFQSTDGAFSWITRQGSLVQRVAFGRFHQAFQEVVDGRHVYDRTLESSGQVPWNEEVWSGDVESSMIVTQMLAYTGAFGGAAGLTNPAVLLREARQDASSMIPLGHTRLGGEAATEERITIPFARLDRSPADLRQYEAQTGSAVLLFTLWLDAEGRLAQLRWTVRVDQDLSANTEADPARSVADNPQAGPVLSFELALTVAFSHYRTAVAAAIPPASDIAHVVQCRAHGDDPTCAGTPVSAG